MKKSIIALFFVLFIGTISASAQKQYCFENEGLKATTGILFTVSGNKITDGEYTSTEYDENATPIKATFTGTKVGNVLTIKFAGKAPDEFMKIKTIKWTMGKSLKVQMYGKNYTTNKWGVYSATFTGCDIN
jgi:hypothetical protein